MKSKSQEPPHADEAERAVLGCILLHAAEALPIVREELSPEHMYRPAHQKLLDAMYKSHDAGLPPDLAVVLPELERKGQLAEVGGRESLLDLCEEYWSVDVLKGYVELVLEHDYRRRALARIPGLERALRESTSATLIDDVARILKGIGSGSGRNRSSVNTVCLADVEREVMPWLWYPRIPRRCLTLLEGDPGLGKSYLSTYLTAAVTRGSRLPDDGEHGSEPSPANVLLMTAEDGLGDTVRPRLEQAGADLARVFAITGVSVPGKPGEECEVAVSLDNLAAIDEALAKYRPALIIIDPIQAYMGRDVDMYRANHVRPVLDGLARLAKKYDAAVVLIRHLAKSTGGSQMVYRGLGSIDFTGAARSVLHVARNPKAEDDVGRRVVAHVKSNSGKHASPLGFCIDDDGFCFEGVVEITEDDLRAAEGPHKKNNPGRPPHERQEAEEFLREVLADGPKTARLIYGRGKDRDPPLGERTLQRAADQIGVVRTGGRGGVVSTWALPDSAATDKSHGEEFCRADSVGQPTGPGSAPNTPNPARQNLPDRTHTLGGVSLSAGESPAAAAHRAAAREAQRADDDWGNV